MARRERGEGSVYQDRQGQWWAKVPILDGSGGCRRTRAAPNTRQEAERRRKTLVAERDGGTHLREAQRRCETYLQEWLVIKAQKVEAGSVAFYKRHVEYALPYIGRHPLERVNAPMLERMFAALEADGLNVTSVGHVRAVLRNAFNYAVKNGILARNPVLTTDAPRASGFQALALTFDETAALLDAARGERLEAFIHMALALGLRKCELLRLHWRDVDLEARTLKVQRSKSRAGRRALPLPDVLVALLRYHWARQQEERAITPGWKEHGLVFPSEVGTPMDGRNVLKIFKRIAVAAGLPATLRIHDLRHTAITQWIGTGADPKSAQSLAGHADPRLTLQIYAQAEAERLRGSVEAAETERARRRRAQ
jgi:integrase